MKQLKFILLLLSVFLTQQMYGQHAVTAKYSTNSYYGWFQGKNGSDQRGFYLGYGNGSDVVNFQLDKASKLYFNGGDFYIGSWSTAGNYTSRSKLFIQGDVFSRNGWYRTYDQRGLYSQTYGTHFYPISANYWRLRSNRGLEIFGKDNKRKGVLYHNNANSFGLLDGDGNWALQLEKDNYTSLKINNVEQLRLTNGNAKFSGSVDITGGNVRVPNAGLIVGAWNKATSDKLHVNGDANITGVIKSSGKAITNSNGNLLINNEVKFATGNQWSGFAVTGTGPAYGPNNNTDKIGNLYFRFRDDAATEGARTVLSLSPRQVSMRSDKILMDGVFSSKYRHEDSNNYVEVGFQDEDGRFKIGVEDGSNNNFNIFNLNPDTKKIGIGGNHDSETYIYGKLIIKKNPSANDLASVDVPSGFTPTKEDFKWYGRADYVFSDEYDLKPLEEVETFIKKNKHLPGVKSALDITLEGYDVLEETNVLLEKVEELTLYIIEQQKQIDELKGLVNSSKED